MHATSAITVTDAWQDAWDGYELRELSRDRSRTTIANKRSGIMLMAHHFTAEGAAEPCQLKKVQVNRYLLRQYDGRKPGGRVALYQTIKSFFDWLAEEYEVPNPMAGIPRPKGSIPSVPVVKPEDLPALLAACKARTAAGTARNTAILWLMIESGLRRFEIVNLDLADVGDLRARTVTVRRGKGGKARISVFGDETAAALHRHITRYRGKQDGPLFLSAQGKNQRITPSGLSQIIKRISRQSGVRVRPHMFRHTWAHECLSAGIPENSLLSLGGWSSSAMLTRYGASMAQERAIAVGREIQVGQRMKAAR